MDTDQQLVIYGAYGFTGELITEVAVKKGLKPLLAGRNEEKLRSLANRFDLGNAVFGVNEKERQESTGTFYGEVENAKGIKKSAGLRTPEGYSLTAATAVLIAEKVLNGNFKPGYMTPSMAYGCNLILEIPGTKMYNI